MPLLSIGTVPAFSVEFRGIMCRTFPIVPTLCMRAVKALLSLKVSTGSPEAFLPAYAYKYQTNMY